VPTSEADNDGDTWLVCDGDCDDAAATTNPGAAELCDGVDNDCDNVADNGLTFDADGDGYTSIGSCTGSGDDCDDNDVDSYPGNPEVCDGADNDCAGGVDDGLTSDVDGDGYTAIGSCAGSADDCDDTDSFTNPGGVEICDGNDNDCNGSMSGNETDDDNDGVLACDGDCDDTDADVWPGAVETVCDEDDMNCDGVISYDPNLCGDDDDSTSGDDDDATGDDDDATGDDDDATGDDDDATGDDDDATGDDDDAGDDDDDGAGGRGSSRRSCQTSGGGGLPGLLALLGLAGVLRRRVA